MANIIMCWASNVKCSVQIPSNPRGRGRATNAKLKKPVMKELQKSAITIDPSKAIKTASLAILNAFVDSVFQFIDIPLLPSQLNFAPVDEIGETVNNLPVEGELPDDFPDGIYLRNGANPLFGGLKSTKSVFGRSENVWVEGEGMLHALYITKDSNGKQCFAYNKKYVETQTFKMEKQRPKPAFLPAITGDPPAILAALFLNTTRFGKPNKILSNTNVFEHGGKYYSVAENFLPQEIDILSLETLGNWDPNEAWARPFTSHPKKAPRTGELVILGIDGKKPYCMMGVISADGKELSHKFDLKMDRCTVFHDFGVTEKYNVVVDHPLTVDGSRLAKGDQLIKYEKDKEARIGVIPRYGDADSIKWFRVESGCSFHFFNSFEDGDEVILRGCKSNAAIIPGHSWGTDRLDWFSRAFKRVSSLKSPNDQGPSTEEGMLFTCVCEWRLNMVTGEVNQRDLSGNEISLDFPMINEHFIGLKHKYGYTQVIDPEASSSSGKSKYGGLAKLYFEEQAGLGEQVKMEYHEFPKNNYCTGSAFVGKPGGGIAEDDGWIITFVHNEDTNKSYVLVVDAKRLEEDPIAKISLPQRVPYGHHGAFFRLPKKTLESNI